MIKVCKFGGTSMADAKALKQVKSILDADPDRRYVVVSAPGKRHKTDISIVFIRNRIILHKYKQNNL